MNPPQQSSKPLSAIIAHQRDIEKLIAITKNHTLESMTLDFSYAGRNARAFLQLFLRNTPEEKLSLITKLDILHTYFDSWPCFQALSHLEALSVSHSNLSGARVNIDNFPHLKKLIFYATEFTTPPELSNLPNLEALILSGANLVLPPALNKITRLETLDLSDNPLALSPELSKNPTLKNVSLSNTNLKELPAGFENLLQLKWLRLDDNPLSQSLDFSKFERLETILLKNCGLTKLPLLSNAGTITKIDLSHNKLTMLPENIISLRNVRTLCLHNNHLSERPKLNELQHLEKLNITNNHFTNPASPVIAQHDDSYHQENNSHTRTNIAEILCTMNNASFDSIQIDLTSAHDVTNTALPQLFSLLEHSARIKKVRLTLGK